MRRAIPLSTVLLFSVPAWSQSTVTAPGISIAPAADNGRATYSVISRRATLPVANGAVPAIPPIPLAPLVPQPAAQPVTPVAAPSPVAAPPPPPVEVVAPPPPAAPSAPPTVTFGGMTWTFAPDGTVIPATSDATPSRGAPPAVLAASDPGASAAVAANQGLTLGGAVPGPRFLFMALPMVTPQGRFVTPEPPPLAPGALRATITLPAVASATPSGVEPWVPYPTSRFGVDPLRLAAPEVGVSREAGSGFQVGGASEVTQGGFTLSSTPGATLRNPDPR